MLEQPPKRGRPSKTTLEARKEVLVLNRRNSTRAINSALTMFKNRDYNGPGGDNGYELNPKASSKRIAAIHDMFDNGGKRTRRTRISNIDRMYSRNSKGSPIRFKESD